MSLDILANRGSTSIQLLAFILLAMILLRQGTMSARETKTAFERSNAEKQLLFDLRRAKSEALRRGGRVIVTPTTDNLGYLVGVDYPPYDLDTTPDQVIFRASLPRNFSLTFSSPLIFDSRGVLINSDGEIDNESVTLNHEETPFYTVTATGLSALKTVKN